MLCPDADVSSLAIGEHSIVAGADGAFEIPDAHVAELEAVGWVCVDDSGFAAAVDAMPKLAGVVAIELVGDPSPDAPGAPLAPEGEDEAAGGAPEPLEAAGGAVPDAGEGAEG